MRVVAKQVVLIGIQLGSFDQLDREIVGEPETFTLPSSG
jgi:hypothetical protein